MNLVKINGNSYYIPAATNIGVYQFKDKYTLLVDTGDNKQQARKIDETLQASQLSAKYIVNTHSHIDHAGGNIYFQEHYPGCVIHTSQAEKLWIENGTLFPMYIYGGSPIRELSRHFLKAEGNIVHAVLTPGVNRINDEKFEIIPLPGHTAGQIAIATRDRVCYLGDTLFSEQIMAKYSFPFLFDIADQMQSMQVIENLDYDYFVVSHAEQIYNAEEIKNLVRQNQSNLEEYLDLSIDILTQPKTREEFLEELVILKDLTLDYKEYYFSLSTAAAIIAYLYHQELLDYQVENGKLYYFRKG